MEKHICFNSSEFNEVNKCKNSWKVSLYFEPDFSWFHDKLMAYNLIDISN